MRLLRRLRRLVFLGAIVGTFIGVRRATKAKQATPQVGPTPTWPPLDRAEEPVAAVGDLVTDGSTQHSDTRPNTLADVIAEGAVPDPEDSAAQWIAAEDGSCPVSHPIKANSNSMIYHSPGGRFYERTRAERCYVDAATAERDGYRAAKGANPGSESQ